MHAYISLCVEDSGQDHSQTYFLYTHTHTHTHSFTASCFSLHDVLAVEPDNGNASFSLGLIYYDLHNYSSAEKWFLRSLELAPNDSGSLYNLGVMLTGEKRYDCVRPGMRDPS